MKLLLDTHIWVRTQLEPGRLSRRVQKVLSDSRSELWISPMSVAEFWMLHRKKRIELDELPEDWLPKALMGLREAPVINEVATVSGRYLDTLPDPADRIIAATAAVYSLRLVTADDALCALKDIEVLPNSA